MDLDAEGVFVSKPIWLQEYIWRCSLCDCLFSLPRFPVFPGISRSKGNRKESLEG